MNDTTTSIAELKARISLEGVRQARDVIAPYLPRTPLMKHPLLADELGIDLHVKHENHLPTGAFKIRGGYNYLHHLSPEDRRRGVVTATRGNHGQSIALAAQTFGVRAVIVVPIGNNPEKNAAMRAQGAEVVEHGRDYDEARERVEHYVRDESLIYIHGGNEPHLIHGVGTYSLEIIEDLPEVDVIVLPVGGGSAICGAVTVFRALRPETRIIGVQASEAPANALSWREKTIVTTESANTFADGLATRVPFELCFEIMKDGVDDMVLVTEEEIRAAVKLLLRTTHNLAEGAAAAATAGIQKIREELAGKTVATVISGGNMDLDTLRWVLRE